MWIPHLPTLATLEDRVTVHDANLMLMHWEASLCAREMRRLARVRLHYGAQKLQVLYKLAT